MPDLTLNSPATEDLIGKLSERIGQLAASHDWLAVQLETAQRNVAALRGYASELERQGEDWKRERQALITQLQALQPPPPPHPTRKGKGQK